MQKSVNFKNSDNNLFLPPSKNASLDSHKAFIKAAFGVTSPYAVEADNLISEKQIQILEDAIKRYERLEDIRKFTNLALQEIDTVTEEDIKRAVELEQMVSIEDDKAVLALIQNEGFLHDLTEGDFSEILNNDDVPVDLQNPFKSPVDAHNPDDYFDDFDF